MSASSRALPTTLPVRAKRITERQRKNTAEEDRPRAPALFINQSLLLIPKRTNGMAINKGNIKLFAPQRLTDVDEDDGNDWARGAISFY